MLELGEFLVKFVHRHLVSAPVVIQLGLELPRLLVALAAVFLKVSCLVLQIVPLFDQVFDVDLEVL